MELNGKVGALLKEKGITAYRLAADGAYLRGTRKP